MTYELDAGRWVPVVKHEFYGRTREEAIGVMQAHERTDSFLRACVGAPPGTSSRFDGITCRTETLVLQV